MPQRNNLPNAYSLFCCVSFSLSVFAQSKKESKFAWSPPGHGWSNHREWEILLNGAVPVVEFHPSFLELYRGLPVVQVRFSGGLAVVQVKVDNLSPITILLVVFRLLSLSWQSIPPSLLTILLHSPFPPPCTSPHTHTGGHRCEIGQS